MRRHRSAARIAYFTAASQPQTPPLDAVTEAIYRYGVPEIFNTDQGSQFTSTDFVALIRDNGIKICMDGMGCWRDNVFVRTAVTLSEARRGLSLRLRQRLAGQDGADEILRALQHSPATQQFRRHTAGSNLLWQPARNQDGSMSYHRLSTAPLASRHRGRAAMPWITGNHKAVIRKYLIVTVVYVLVYMHNTALRKG